MTQFTPVWKTPASKIATTREGNSLDINLQVEDIFAATAEAGAVLQWLGSTTGTVQSVKVNGSSIPVSYAGLAVKFGPLVQLSTVKIYVEGVEPFVQTGGVGLSVLAVSTNQRTIQKVTIDDVEVPFEIVDMAVGLPGVSTATNIQITRTGAMGITLLNGALPPGIRLNRETGKLSGTVGNIISDTIVTYKFTVRASNGVAVRDRSFTIEAGPFDEAGFFNEDSLSAPQFNDTLGITYHTLGSYDRADPFAVSLDIIDPDGVLPPIEIKRVTGLPENGEYWGGMPSGLNLVGTRIEGIISSTAETGLYFFEIHIKDPVATQAKTFMIEVKHDVDASVRIIPKVEWITGSGYLGEIVEGEPCPFTVTARLIGQGELRYHLAPRSGPLPAGFLLDDLTGDIRGVASHLDLDTTYDFVVRAISGQTFEDRAFSMAIRKRFNADKVYNLFLRMTATERFEFSLPYKRLFPQSMLFRSDDRNFGYVFSPKLYLIKGLDSTKSIETAISGDGSEIIAKNSKDYHGPFKLLMGAHKTAVARDPNGRVLYEVVYRELIDPNYRAGGFDFNSNIPSETKVLYGQSKVTQKYVYPISMRNIRYDLTRDIGFAVDDLNKKYLLGTDGPELLPLWMRCQQVHGNSASVIGFIPAIVIAYIKPGQSEAALNLIAQSQRTPVPNGRVYIFDEYFTSDTIIESHTRFDEDEAVFDLESEHVRTLFDANIIAETGKYI